MPELTAEQHAARRTGVGGSDAPVAAGVSPWRTKYDLWLEKIGELEPRRETEQMRWGTILEPVIREQYQVETGRQVVTVPETLRHPELNWLLGHVDGRIVGEPRILEIKTARDGRDWGQAGTDQIPLHYLLSIQHYLLLTGAAVADVAVLIAGSDFRIYTVEPDPAIHTMLIRHEQAFWQAVELRQPPWPDSVEAAVQRWGKLAVKGTVVADRETEVAVEGLQHVAKERERLEAVEADAKLAVCRALGDDGDRLVNLAGRELVTWRLDSGRAAHYVKASAPRRRFLLKV